MVFCDLFQIRLMNSDHKNEQGHVFNKVMTTRDMYNLVTAFIVTKPFIYKYIYVKSL